MALEYVGGASGVGTDVDYTVSLTALTGGIGTAPQAGDVVVVVSGYNYVTDGNPGPTTAGYTEVADLYANNGYDTNLSVAYKVMGATPDTGVTVTGSGSATYGAATVVHVWRGVDTASPMDVAATTATGINGTDIDSPAITPVTAGAMVLSCGLMAGTDATRTAPTGYGNAVQASASGTRGALAVVASKAWTSGAEDPAGWTGGTTSTAMSWAAVTLALRPAAAGGGTPSGSLSATFGALAATAVGTLTLAASLAGTFGAFTASGTGTLANTGAANGTFAAATLTATGAGQTAIVGSLASTFGALTTDTSGALVLRGQASNTLAAATAEATGALAIQATASPTLQPATASATGALALQASAAGAFEALTTDATATLALTGAANHTFAPLTVTATSGAITFGTADLTLAPLTSAATGALGIAGVTTATFDAATAQGAATLSLRGNASPTLAPLQSTATAALPILASLNASFGALTLTGASTPAERSPPFFDYSSMTDSATRLLKLFGAPATLQRQTSTSYDPATSLGGVTETLMPTTAVVVSYQQDYVDGSLILQGDRRALCDPAVEPLTGDRFAWQGKEYTVVGVTPVAPAGIALLFEAQIRG